ncbi:hypothetical protein GDO86_001473 [Hymenochirus boettgeri]|uniref:gluconokinase n=1 Tax=Hymenochirus boettgeri TaxID=247094 RepID=A0A8T2KCV4_9PIPI|nr:hypothetical protein GDO86_001473 [Hymenochirus boettgeri]
MVRLGVSYCDLRIVDFQLEYNLLSSPLLGWKFYDADDYHPLENKLKMSQGIPLNDQTAKRKGHFMPITLLVPNRHIRASSSTRVFYYIDVDRDILEILLQIQEELGKMIKLENSCL